MTIRRRRKQGFASTAQYEPGPYGVYADVLARWHVEDGAVEQITVNSKR